MKRTILLLGLALWCDMAAGAPRPKIYTVTSPDGKNTLELTVGERISYRILSSKETVVAPSSISLTLTDGTVWGTNPRVTKATRTTVNKVISSPVYKRSEVKDHFNQTSVQFRGGYAIDLRAYDDGVAYRWRTVSDKPVQIASEQVEFTFPGDLNTVVPYVRNRSGKEMTFTQQFSNSFENVYTHTKLSGLDPKRLMFLPLVTELPSGRKICITEAYLESYPGMFLNNPDGGNTLKGVFAPYPKSTKTGGHRGLEQLVTEAEPYIARIDGIRKLPWRTVIIADADKDLLDSDMTYKLASPSRVDDPSWIKPGKVAWEWWNDRGVYGVDFKTGINTETYKYYIDFATEHGIEYIILDEGWSVRGKCDLLQIVPEIDLKQIIDYGQSKNVGIILWAGYAAMDKDVEGVFKHYAAMGVKGFKIDYMNRDDQQLVEFIYKVADAAVRNKLLIDFHGMYKPTGLNRTYPNLINFEGVHGLETAKWTPIETADQVTYDVTVPFIRMVAGPMDYTQGAMLNGTKKTFRAVNSQPMSPGTRCRQLAEYVIFESPLNMLCDSPINYRREPECTEFIAQIPTVWTQTVALDGKIGEYAAIARRKGDSWWVGVLTNWDARTLTLDLSALNLPAGKYTVTLFRDGVNADRYAEDYKKENFTLAPDRKLTVEMAPGGGAAAIISKED